MAFSVNLPCKVGDEVWTYKTHRYTKVACKGKVTEIYFIDESMQPCIVVKGVTRGAWGEKIFATKEDVERVI